MIFWFPEFHASEIDSQAKIYDFFQDSAFVPGKIEVLKRVVIMSSENSFDKIFAKKLANVQHILQQAQSEWEQGLIIGSLMLEAEDESRQFCTVCKKPCKTSCTKCKAVYYCSKDCQVKDWKEACHYDADFDEFLRVSSGLAVEYDVDIKADCQTGKHKNHCERLKLARIDRIWSYAEEFGLLGLKKLKITGEKFPLSWDEFFKSEQNLRKYLQEMARSTSEMQKVITKFLKLEHVEISEASIKRRVTNCMTAPMTLMLSILRSGVLKSKKSINVIVVVDDKKKSLGRSKFFFR